MLKNIKVKIEGIHCNSCKILIETEIDVLGGVSRVEVNHQTGECQIEFDDEKVSQSKIFHEIEKLKYKVKPIEDLSIKESAEKDTSSDDFTLKISRKWVVIAGLFLLFVVGYALIEYLNLFEIFAQLNEQKISYWLILLIGLLAGFHCVGMCGGLVVTYTARHHAKNENKKKASLQPHFQYNLGRMVSYTLIGAVLGGLGSFFGINPIFTGVVTLVAGIFMVLMGLSLATNFKWLDKVKLKTPAFIARFLYNQRYTKKPKGPFVIGLLNGFMPCGPLQAMQLYALASGSVTQGALSMAIYALGTIPLMFGFGSFISLISQDRIKQIMKVSGVIVVVLGLFMFNRGLVNFGYGFRSFIPRESSSRLEYTIDDNAEYQTVNMDLTYKGYEPNVIFIKKGVPVRWVVNVKQMTGCTDEILLPEYNIRKTLQYGENIIEFVPDRLGDIKFSCWMQMVWGKFVVTGNGEQPNNEELLKESLKLPPSGSCGAGESGGCGCGG